MLDGTLRAAAERWGQTPAYVATQGWALSYADLDRLAGEVAVGLAERGLVEGDVLALVLPPTPEYLVAYLAAARLGATTAGVNGRLTPDERAAVLARAGAAMVLATADLAPTGRRRHGGRTGGREGGPAGHPAGVRSRRPGAGR